MRAAQGQAKDGCTPTRFGRRPRSGNFPIDARPRHCGSWVGQPLAKVTSRATCLFSNPACRRAWCDRHVKRRAILTPDRTTSPCVPFFCSLKLTLILLQSWLFHFHAAFLAVGRCGRETQVYAMLALSAAPAFALAGMTKRGTTPQEPQEVRDPRQTGHSGDRVRRRASGRSLIVPQANGGSPEWAGLKCVRVAGEASA